MGQSFSFISSLLLDQVGPYLLPSGFCSAELVDLESETVGVWESPHLGGTLIPGRLVSSLLLQPDGKN